MSFILKPAHPEWLKEACVEAEKLFRLINEGRVPDSIVAWMVVTKCLRVLRCIYGGSNKDVACAILERDKDKIGLRYDPETK